MLDVINSDFGKMQHLLKQVPKYNISKQKLYYYIYAHHFRVNYTIGDSWLQ